MEPTFTKILLDKKSISEESCKDVKNYHGFSIISEQTLCNFFGGSFTKCSVLNSKDGEKFKVCNQETQTCISIIDGINVFKQIAEIRKNNLINPEEYTACNMIKLMIIKGQKEQTI